MQTTGLVSSSFYKYVNRLLANRFVVKAKRGRYFLAGGPG